jgi:hypothetical protein
VAVKFLVVVAPAVTVTLALAGTNAVQLLREFDTGVAV